MWPVFARFAQVVCNDVFKRASQKSLNTVALLIGRWSLALCMACMLAVPMTPTVALAKQPDNIGGVGDSESKTERSGLAADDADGADDLAEGTSEKTGSGEENDVVTSDETMPEGASVPGEAPVSDTVIAPGEATAEGEDGQPDASGSEENSVDVDKAAETNQTLPLSEEAGAVSASEYSLVVQGADDATLGDAAFIGKIAPIENAAVTLQANVYRTAAAEGENAQGANEKTRVRDDCWIYRWLAADSASAVEEDCVAIEGQTSSTLTVDEALAEQLAGKYLYVKVTGTGGASLFGPAESSLAVGPVVTAETAPVAIALAGDAAADAFTGEGLTVMSDPASEAEWPAFASGAKNGAVVKDVQTPTASAKLGWEFDPFEGQGGSNVMKMSGLSDPLIINKDVYVIGGSTMYRLDASTGKVKAQASTGLPDKFYFSRPAYADGLIYAAANDGRVAAFDVNTLRCAWCTKPLPSPGKDKGGKDLKYQSLASITAHEGKVYAFFSVPEEVGTRLCVEAATGTVLWSKTDRATGDSKADYYWAGGCPSGSDLLIADGSGNVKLIDLKTGSTKAKVSIRRASRSGVVVLDDVDDQGNGTYLAVSRDDGVLHRIIRKGNKLTEAGKVKFAGTSTSTPAVANGKAFICGTDSSNKAVLAIIDLQTMKVEKRLSTNIRGSAQASPLVSVRSDGTYVYFTINDKIGAAYVYKYGDDKVQLLYKPSEDDQQWCTASVIADSVGNLYYSNDTRKLFKLLGEGVPDDASGGDPGDDPGDNSSDDPGGDPGGDPSDGPGGDPRGNPSDDPNGKKPTNSEQELTPKERYRMILTSKSSSRPAANQQVRRSSAPFSIAGEDKNSRNIEDFADKVKEPGKTERRGATASSEASESVKEVRTDMGGIESKRSLPIWPIVGSALAALVTAGLLFAMYRRSQV